MFKVHELRAERAKINDQIQALATTEKESGSLSDEQTSEFSALSAKFNDLTASIERLEAAERMAAQSATPAQNHVRSTSTVPVTPRVPEAKGAGMARMVLALAAAQGNNQLAAQIAMDRGYGEHIAASLNTLTPGAGGVLVPENLSTEVIELLRPKSVVRKLGARAMPLNNGNLTIPRLKGGAVVGYIGSDSDIPTSQQEFNDLKLSAKKLTGLVPISNDLLANSGANPNVDQIVVSDLTSAMGTREDKAFIRDSGSGNTPKGLRYWAPTQNVYAAAQPKPSIEQVSIELNKLVLVLESADANMTAVGWVMAPRTKRFLQALRDGNGNKVYPELDQGFLMGYPVGTTTQIPINLAVGADSNGSEIYLADFGDCFIGEDSHLVIDFSKEATYTDDKGNTVSAFQRDQTLVRVIAKHDFGPRHVESVAVLIDVQWGA
ncbi:phage major capsid protein [Alcaligenes endophyticus]|uniref:Phage major capsid protein n=1 Tax=Alcaligenes endophyticus TaxID=1929088 RepID=A0ABT8EK97_9BURK|nr:phage major capsid protein [Alcaligenes endophyticus]MCX5592031.1 phage major capsid protein [Alcaligenes endophyticus]MDN4121721.1 phage major capsid protein [Alcaligenes endophyticus]